MKRNVVACMMAVIMASSICVPIAADSSVASVESGAESLATSNPDTPAADTPFDLSWLWKLLAGIIFPLLLVICVVLLKRKA